MTSINWEAPPEALLNRQRRDWQNVADELRARPGQWAVVAEGVSASTGTHIRHGRLTAFAPAGSFEARVSGARSDEGKASKVYARYIGASTPAPTPTAETTETAEVVTSLSDLYSDTF